MYTFLEENSILPQEQKGCKRNSYGYNDQLLINKLILENCGKKNRNLRTAWIDYKKAFESVPHEWILKAIELYKICPIISNFLRTSMTKWQTRLLLSHDNGTLKSDPIKIKCGIFQGHSLSPFLFCLALIPLSNELNNPGYGYKIFDRTINQLFYMDNLKLFTKNDQDLEGLLNTVKEFSNDIGMEFGLDKCAKAPFIRGKLQKTSSINLDIDTAIRDLDPEETCKYLGVNEGDRINHASMKEKIRKEYNRRIRLVLKTELNSENRIEAINTLAVPVVQYSFNIINWNLADLSRLDTKTRKLLAPNKMHHSKANELETSYKTTAIGMQNYLTVSNDWIIQLVCQHDENKKLHSIVKETRRFKREFELENENTVNEDLPLTK